MSKLNGGEIFHLIYWKTSLLKLQIQIKIPIVCTFYKIFFTFSNIVGLRISCHAKRFMCIHNILNWQKNFTQTHTF